MPVKHNPKGTPLPDDHPLKGGLIVFGAKRRSSSKSSSAPENSSNPKSIEQEYEEALRRAINSPSKRVITEEEERQQGTYRLAKMRHQSQAFRDQSRNLSKSRTGKPEEDD